MTTGSTRQRCIRFGGDLEEKLMALANEEGRSFSSQVTYLLRQALAQRALTRPQQQREQHVAA